MATFTIRIPDSWQSYDLSGEELAARRAAVLGQMPEPDRRAEVNRTFRELRTLLEGARRRGAVCAAGTVARHDDGLLVASLAVFLLSAPRGRPLGLDELARQAGRGSAGRTVRRAVRAVRLPAAGDAARVIGVERVLVGRVHVEQLVMHTILPLPPGDRLLLVSCASPNLMLADPLEELFAAITDTVDVTRGEDE
jgi:hypothetical protein